MGSWKLRSYVMGRVWGANVDPVSSAIDSIMNLCPAYVGTTWEVVMDLCWWHGRGLLQTWLLTQNTWVCWRWVWAQDLSNITFHVYMNSTGGTTRSSRIEGLKHSIVKPNLLLASTLQTPLMCCDIYSVSAMSTSLNISSTFILILAIALGQKGWLLTR